MLGTHSLTHSFSWLKFIGNDKIWWVPIIFNDSPNFVVFKKF